MRTKDKELIDRIKVYIENQYEQSGRTPSIRDIAGALEIGKSSVQRYLEYMVEQGILAKGNYGYESIEQSRTERTVSVAKLGYIPCGPLSEEYECIDGYVRLPASFVGNAKKCFLLTASGNSMIDVGITDGDLVLVRIKKYQKFLSEMTVDEHGNKRPTHERLLKAERSLLKLIKENTLFTYLDKEFINDFIAPSTNNRIEGGINSRLREMLRNHRGLSIERRIKAVYWWCYMHSPEPLPLSEIVKVMPTEQSIAAIYQRMNEKNRLEKSLSIWGDAIVWSDLHKMDRTFDGWD